MSSNIIINGNPIGDPQPSRDAANTNYIYIQGRERLTKDQKQQLSDLHVEIYEYVENNTCTPIKKPLSIAILYNAY